MSEARLTRDPDFLQLLAGGSASAYDVWQLPTGEVGFFDQATAITSGNYALPRKRGALTMNKTVGSVLLAGQRVFWDYANNKINFKKTANSRDFFAGVMAEDCTSAALTGLVYVNQDQRFDIDIARDSHLTVPVGTQGLNTMGVFRRGGAHKLILSTANEAQKLDILGVDDLKVTGKTILEGQFRIVNGGAGSAPDFNIGVASATHATDFDSIAEYCSLHIDGNSTVVSGQSKDGTTTVAATTLASAYTAGSGIAARYYFQMDLRDLTSIKLYVNGARVASGTTFRLDNAVGPLYPIIHLEKTAAADVFEVDVDYLRCWNSEQ